MLTTDDPVAFAFGNRVSGHAMLFRRELLERALPAPLGFFYDWWIAAVAASVGGVVSCERSLVLYRQPGGNVTDARLAEMVEEAGIVAQRRSGAGRDRSRGHKLLYLRETEQRLASLARLLRAASVIHRKTASIVVRVGEAMVLSDAWLLHGSPSRSAACDHHNAPQEKETILPAVLLGSAVEAAD